MITGDQKPTAVAISRQLGIFEDGDAVITGAELGGMSREELDAKIDSIKVYARTSPEQKLRIVEALKRHGKVVAMTGDGVNDAPALKQADIGVAMGVTGTDVSRQAADMILMDDNFATIVSAVEEGRKIYDNVKNVVRYLFSSNLGEVLVVFLAIMLGMPLPLMAVQILWVNLVTDSLPALALSVDPVAPGVMKRPPRPGMRAYLPGLRFLTWGCSAPRRVSAPLASSIFTCPGPGHRPYGRVHGFSGVPDVELPELPSRRSIFKVGLFSNMYIIAAIIASILVQCVLLYTPFLEGLFNTVPLSASDWLAIALVTSSVFILAEARKFFLLKLGEHR